MTQFITGEAVAVDLRVARLGSRSVAVLLDFMLEVVAFLVLTGLLLVAAAGDAALAAAFTLTAYVLVFVGYPATLETTWSGRTLGKAALGLRAVREDGGPLRFRQALTRALLGAIVELPGATLGIAAVVSSLVSRRGKRLGDLLAGTVVVQERVPVSGVTLPALPPHLYGYAGSLDVSRLGDDLALAARQFLGRAHELTDDARERVGASLTTAVQAVVAPPPPPGTPGWAYLTAVLAERRRRATERLGLVGPPGGATGWPGAGGAWPSVAYAAPGSGYGPAPRYGPPGYGPPPGYGSPGYPPPEHAAQGYGPPPVYGPPPGFSPPPGYGSPPGYGQPVGTPTGSGPEGSAAPTGAGGRVPISTGAPETPGSPWARPAAEAASPDGPGTSPDRPGGSPDRPAASPGGPGASPDRPGASPDRPSTAADRAATTADGREARPGEVPPFTTPG